MTHPDPIDRILDDVTDYVRYQREEGHTHVEVPSDLIKPNRPQTTVRPSPVKTADAAQEPTPMEAVARSVASCTRCGLHQTRTRTVPGQGNEHPEILFVGEGPGAEEDLQGLAFVGRAGKLLTRMIEAMGYTRDEVFIGNIVKCRPPDNRVPLPDEMETCLPYLKQQIAILKPKVIVALGATAVKGLLNTTTGITRLRGQWHTFEGIDVMPTFHPAYLLRNASKKKEAWEDLKAVLKKLGRTPPPIKATPETGT